MAKKSKAILLSSILLGGLILSTATSCGEANPEADKPVEVQTGTIVIDKGEGGDVICNKTTAKVGETVSFIVVPDATHEIDSVIVNGVETTVDADGKGTIVIEEGENTIEATFKAKEDEGGGNEGGGESGGETETETGTITLSTFVNGSVSVVDPKDTYNVDDEVTLTVTPNTGYHVTEVKNNSTVITAVDGVYKITIVKGDNIITATFAKDEEVVTEKVVYFNVPQWLNSGKLQVVAKDADNNQIGEPTILTNGTAGATGYTKYAYTLPETAAKINFDKFDGDTFLYKSGDIQVSDLETTNAIYFGNKPLMHMNVVEHKKVAADAEAPTGFKEYNPVNYYVSAPTWVFEQTNALVVNYYNGDTYVDKYEISGATAQDSTLNGRKYYTFQFNEGELPEKVELCFFKLPAEQGDENKGYKFKVDKVALNSFGEGNDTIYIMGEKAEGEIVSHMFGVKGTLPEIPTRKMNIYVSWKNIAQKIEGSNIYMYNSQDPSKNNGTIQDNDSHVNGWPGALMTAYEGVSGLYKMENVETIDYDKVMFNCSNNTGIKSSTFDLSTWSEAKPVYLIKDQKNAAGEYEGEWITLEEAKKPEPEYVAENYDIYFRPTYEIEEKLKDTKYQLNVYAYKDKSDPFVENHAWPGEAMTKVDNSSDYKVTLDSKIYTHLKFAVVDTTITADEKHSEVVLEYPAGDKSNIAIDYTKAVDTKEILYVNDKWVDYPSDEQATKPENPEAKTYTINVDFDTYWVGCDNIYYYVDGLYGSTPKPNEWPGKNIKADLVDNTYTFDITPTKDTVIVFHENKNDGLKTPDIRIPFNEVKGKDINIKVNNDKSFNLNFESIYTFTKVYVDWSAAENRLDYSNIYLYKAGADPEVNNAKFPGQLMKEENEYYGHYSFEVPLEKYDHAVFVTGKDSGIKTIDIDLSNFDQQKPVFKVDAKGTWNEGDKKVVHGGEFVALDPAKKLLSPAEYDTLVYIGIMGSALDDVYFYDTKTGNNPAYPGVLMERTSVKGVYGIKGRSLANGDAVIFNLGSGKAQTIDIIISGGDVTPGFCYKITDKQQDGGKYYGIFVDYTTINKQ